MNPESSTPLRGLLARLAAVILAAGLLYVLGAGPAAFYQTRYDNTFGGRGSAAVYGLLQKAYAPLEAVMQRDLKTPLSKYRLWWREQAEKRYPFIWITTL